MRNMLIWVFITLVLSSCTKTNDENEEVTTINPYDTYKHFVYESEALSDETLLENGYEKYDKTSNEFTTVFIKDIGSPRMGISFEVVGERLKEENYDYFKQSRVEEGEIKYHGLNLIYVPSDTEFVTTNINALIGEASDENDNDIYVYYYTENNDDESSVDDGHNHSDPSCIGTYDFNTTSIKFIEPCEYENATPLAIKAVQKLLNELATLQS